MATVKKVLSYRCDNDCTHFGCPAHEAYLSYQSCSDAYTFRLNDRELHFERGELEAVLTLLRSLDRADCVKV